MSPGQERALRELRRLHAAAPDGFEVVTTPREDGFYVKAHLSLRIGPLERKHGGLLLNDREEFILLIPPDFPFAYPALKVEHDRFARFPHVVWANTICLYQSKIEWNPTDGLFGYFERLSLWLARAAANDMDPVEGPLEPPHYVTDFSKLPVVVRANTPVVSGTRWIGWAELQKYHNRVELVGWREDLSNWPTDREPALAIVLDQALPMEFPERGRDFFIELGKQGFGRDLLVRLLGLASLLRGPDEPLFLVLALPMRRGPDGSPRHHVAVWMLDANNASALRNALPRDSDVDEVRKLRSELAEALAALFDAMTIKWCRILEDRSEIISRRDQNSATAWLRRKNILILGCGALGSWMGELVARAEPQRVDLVDNTFVRPGVLVRQNYLPEDIASNKAFALAHRIRALSPTTAVEPFDEEAHAFLSNNRGRLAEYDLVLDCTASNIMQMKLERDWLTIRSELRTLASIVVDGRAQQTLCVGLGKDSKEGPWTAFLRLKNAICEDGRRVSAIESFYSGRAIEALFQPEPGCSDPTFSGSAADVTGQCATVLNLLCANLPKGESSVGFLLSMASRPSPGLSVDVVPLDELTSVSTGPYRVLLSRKFITQVNACIRQNARVRSSAHETGGLVWGHWDDACHTIVVLDASGPPPDSLHDPGHFVCGVRGTLAEHTYRKETSYGACVFIGLWHTHPQLPPEQSVEDIGGMSSLVARMGQNLRRALMIIVGEYSGRPVSGTYVYESQEFGRKQEFIRVGNARLDWTKQ